ncbi:Uncharacterized protein Rs2_40969 [Raphanus sativus]|nr:Uncharacterized protein Rs2_40969 [Raphanus sativus]
MALLEKARVAKQFCSTLRSSKSVYEVNEFECGYSVNLSTHQCACRKWDLTGIPCKHAVYVMDDNQDDPISRCKQAGHISRGCKNEPVVVEGPKNRRGRPRKNTYEIQPKLPRKPRERKKTPATTTSSQHVHSNVTAEADVSCSAPQPSVPTNRLKAHMKKAPRGPPLKIRKTGNIPHGVGTFWSPFTDRPFEVFGDRVYDRSDLNPATSTAPNIQPNDDQMGQPFSDG